MTEQQQREACAELARRMGWREGEFAGIWFPPDGDLKRVQADPPDYFTDHVASWELRLWLASDDDRWRKFTYELFGKAEIKGWDYVRAGMTADPSVIANAACKSLGIKVSE